MPLFWTKEYSLFFYHAEEIWFHHHASCFNNLSVEIRLLYDIVKIPPQTESIFSAFIKDPFHFWIEENQRLLLEHLPFSVEEARVRPYLAIPVDPCIHFFMVFQVYLVLQLKNMFLTLDKILKDENGKEIVAARWRLNKTMNLLTRIFLPQLPEEDIDSILRIIQSLYGFPFVAGVQCVITVDTVHEIEASFTGMLRVLSKKKNTDEYDDLSYRQENISHLIRSPVELPVKICLLLESAGNFSAFLEAY